MQKLFDLSVNSSQIPSAAYRSIDPIELDHLASVAPCDVAARVAMHARVLKRTLAKLACHACPDVRVTVTENSKTPVEVLRRLAADCDSDVRYAMAENHNLPVEILKVLAEDENPYVAYRAQKTIARLESSADPVVVEPVFSAVAS